MCKYWGVKRASAMKGNGWICPAATVRDLESGFEQQHKRQDPKDDELCLRKATSRETLVESRGDTDVRIFRETWVKGRKANLTIQLLVPSEVHLKLAFEQLHQKGE